MQQRFTVIETLPPSKLKGVAQAPSGFGYKHRPIRAVDTLVKRRLKDLLRFSQLLFEPVRIGCCYHFARFLNYGPIGFEGQGRGRLAGEKGCKHQGTKRS